MVHFQSLVDRSDRIAVVGLGYVGLPLAVAFSRHFDTVGFDLNPERIAELQAGRDRTREVDDAELVAAKAQFTADAAALARCRLIVVAVPTPIDTHHRPDFAPLRAASETVGRHLQAGSCVVFESTVYPGATEDVCLPILERESGLRFGSDFRIGYSPERINPGDRVHRLESITKVVSGSDAETTDFLCAVYAAVVPAGIHRAASIRVAEAAKVIENTQRDLNIALMNELAMLFDRMDIDTREVLEAAGTKWNFLRFAPGLVGGHCIGVDPFYLTFKAESLGFHPEMILAGRRINDGMGKYIADKTVKMLIHADRAVHGARVAILGLTFKENVPDLRNTRVVDIIRELNEFGVQATVHDPLADPDEAKRYCHVALAPFESLGDMDAVVVAVGHAAYKNMGLDAVVRLCGRKVPIVLDVKGIFSPVAARDTGVRYWRL